MNHLFIRLYILELDTNIVCCVFAYPNNIYSAVVKETKPAPDSTTTNDNNHQTEQSAAVRYNVLTDPYSARVYHLPITHSLTL